MTDIDELSPEEIEDILEYAAEADAKLRDELAAEREAELERLRPVWEAQEAKRREERNRRIALEYLVRAALTAKGVSLNIDGCGCCGSPGVSIEIDGVLLVDNEAGFNLEMIEVAE